MLRKEIALIGLGALALLAGCAPKAEEATTSSTTTPPGSSNATPPASSGGSLNAEVPSSAGTTTPGTTATTTETPTNAKPAGGMSDSGKEVTTASGLKYVDIKVGTGASPTVGQMVSVHYTGTLTNGEKFDSSHDKPGDAPYPFPIGMGKVVAGWDEGIMTMKVGGKRKLIVPASLGYGETGRGPIPGGATMLFDVELISIK